jgi:fatty acid desaturase
MISVGTTEVVSENYVERHLLDSETYRRFAKHNPARWLLAVLQEYATIGLAIWVCVHFGKWWLYPFAIFLIGTRQHALGIMAHESVHFAVASRRFWNDLLGNLFAAYPLTYSVQGYRTNHLRHHRWLETAKDPERTALDLYPDEWTYPMRRLRFYTLLVRDALLLKQVQAFDLVRYVWEVPSGAGWQVLGVLLYQGTMAFVAWRTGFIWTYVLLWLFPLFSVAIMCFRIRTAAEHSAIGHPEDRYTRETPDTLATTRTTVGGPIGKFLFAPHNMAYHIEHHLYPAVPVFRLKKLHETLLQIPEYAARARVSHGYPQLFRELTATD